MSDEQSKMRLPTIDRLSGPIPGFALIATIAAIAVLAPGRIVPDSMSTLVIALLLGMAIRQGIGRRNLTGEASRITVRYLLRWAIALIGLQLTVPQIAAIGLRDAAAVIAILVSCFIFTKAMGRVLGVGRGLTELIAAGTSICGASAIMAVNTVTRADDEDVSYALVVVTVFGAILMLGYPMAAAALALPDHEYGLWSGATIHEVAQAVGATLPVSEAASESGTVAKLMRVLMLAPLIAVLQFVAVRGNGSGSSRTAIPWFVLAFFAAVVLNSVFSIPEPVLSATKLVSAFLLTMAIVAMGLETDIRRLWKRGLRPVLLGALSTAFIAGLGYALFLAG
ncbi:YeiH family protein [Pacificispira sp.]|uniref:YeiH family protein n=1 Tax=Pacificispira sp. TaxID=2888761 RepID=UPI003B5298C6